VLLHGDAQQYALSELLESNRDLRADLCDLPHHGSFVEASPRWLAGVQPEVVLQSSGIARLIRDPWPPFLEPKRVHRLVTARDSMVEVSIPSTGPLTWWVFTPREAPIR
jgi:hypothetical protein